MKIPVPAQAAQVHYAIDVLDGAGRVVRRLPRKKNLILDQGLDGIAVRTWTDSFSWAAIGTGTTPTKRDSGTVTVSRSGSTLAASAGFFVAGDVGCLFKFDTGEEVRITAFTDASHVTTSTAGTIAAAEGTVWYVNQTALISESARTNTYSTDGGANGSTYSAGTYTHKRTFIFPAVGGTVTYREIGWSHSGTPGANLFGRDLLAGSGVTLVATQQLRVTVELSVSYSPISSAAWANVVTGWTSAGACGIEDISTAVVSWLGANGASAADSGRPFEPSEAEQIGVYTDSGAIRAASNLGAGVTGQIAAKDVVLGSYVAGSFTRSKSVSFGIAEANSTAIRSIASARGTSFCGFRVLLDTAQTKTSSQTLSLTMTLSWGRVLSNA